MASSRLDSTLKSSDPLSKKRLALDPPSYLNQSDVITDLKETRYSIVDLLPQNNSALVRNSKMAFEILKMVYNIIRLLADTIHKFYISKQYSYFDPHVGDTSCQIRAYALVILSKKKIMIL